NSGIGLVAHLGVPFDTTIGGAFAASAVAGAFLGKRLSMSTPPDRLARGFAFMVAIVGVVVLVEEIAVRGKLV
ncbi:MAG: sulfite exporter TauE/SafE family protein, partial [Actinomycetota bacterium]